MASSLSSARVRTLAVAALAAASVATTVTAQDSVVAGRPRLVAGRIVRPTTERNAPVAHAWAVLHRVGSDTAGPLDSMRTDGEGRFRFRYVPRGRDDAIYFVSSSYGGIAYFTPPLHGDSVVGDAAEITVFDTTTRAVPLRVRGRHLVVSASGVDGARSIVEVYELSNDTSVTLVAGPDARATWTTVLPPNAREFSVGQGDVPAQAVTASDGRVLVFAPFPPGVKQLSFSYSLPASSFPLTMPLGGETSVLEILVEDTTGTVTGPRLVPRPPAEIQGRAFRRWLAQDAPASGVITVTLPPRRSVPRNAFISALAALFLGAMALSIVVMFSKRTRLRAARAHMVVAAPVNTEASRLAEEIAALDEAHETFASVDAEERARAHASYAAARATLKSRLADALAARGGRS